MMRATVFCEDIADRRGKYKRTFFVSYFWEAGKLVSLKMLQLVKLYGIKLLGNGAGAVVQENKFT